MSAPLRDGTEFPLPAPRAGDEAGPIWKARYAPATLSREDLAVLADTSAAYSELILRCRPSRFAAVTRSVKDSMRDAVRAKLPEQGI